MIDVLELTMNGFAWPISINLPQSHVDKINGYFDKTHTSKLRPR